jgi:hypothetical protein
MKRMDWTDFVISSSVYRAMQSKLRLALFILVLLIAAATASLAADKTYVNPRFGTTITYPDAIFTKVEPDSVNGSGRKWSAPDDASLAIWGQNNTLDFTPESIADFIAKEIDEVTYRKVGSRWMVVSGFDNGAVVYHRAEFGSGGVIHSMELRYATDLRQRYDRLAGIIADSLIGP